MEGILEGSGGGGEGEKVFECKTQRMTEERRGEWAVWRGEGEGGGSGLFGGG